MKLENKWIIIDKQAQPLTGYLRKRGGSTSLNIWNSIWLWSKIQAEVFQIPLLRKYLIRWLQFFHIHYYHHIFHPY